MSGIRPQALLHQRPGAVPDVALTPQHHAPPEGAEQRFGLEVAGPELRQVGTRLDRVAFEGGQQPVGVPLVPLARKYRQIFEMRDAAAHA